MDSLDISIDSLYFKTEIIFELSVEVKIVCILKMKFVFRSE